MLVHEGDLGGKKHEREQTFRPAQSVSADTLALKTSSWFVKPERGWGVNRPSSLSFRCAAPSTHQLTRVHPPVLSRTTRKDLSTLLSNEEVHTTATWVLSHSQRRARRTLLRRPGGLPETQVARAESTTAASHQPSELEPRLERIRS